MNRVAQHVKDYWPLWGIVIAVATALTTYIGLPKRVEKVEAGQMTMEETFQDYLQEQQEALAEQRGYQKALNERVMQQQAPANAPAPSRQAQRREKSVGFREYEDGVGFWCCDLDEREDCWDEDEDGYTAWVRCD